MLLAIVSTVYATLKMFDDDDDECRLVLCPCEETEESLPTVASLGRGRGEGTDHPG